MLIGTAIPARRRSGGQRERLIAAAPRIIPPVPPSHPRRAQVKVCGLRSEAAIAAAVRADADLAGIVVASGGRRAVDPAAPASWRAASTAARGPSSSSAVPPDEVETAVAASGVRSVQLPGFDAPPDWLPELASGLDDVIGVLHQPAAARA